MLTQRGTGTQTRRVFLRTLAGGPALVALGSSVPWFLQRSACHAAAASALGDRVLVVIQLSGGNDGLNTLVPIDNDVYARSRPTLRIRAADVRRIRDDAGFHPRMAGFERLFKDGRMAILPAVGCPGLSRDHEVAMRAWQMAMPAPPKDGPGWMGLGADRLWSERAPLAPGLFVGGLPTLPGIRPTLTVVPALRAGQDLGAGLAGLPPGPLRPTSAALAAARSGEPPLLRHVRASLVAAVAQADRWSGIDAAAPRADYPACDLGEELRAVARLIRSRSGVTLFHLELGGGGIGGFDNHANQWGNHCALLAQLSESVAAFAADLAADGWLDRVVLMTFSEFGRTVAENGRRGTDHGSGGPMFLVGGNVVPGLHGAVPDLSELDEGAVKPTLDFRGVYSAVLEDWLGLPSEAILGGRFPRPRLLAPA